MGIKERDIGGEDREKDMEFFSGNGWREVDINY